MCEPTTIAAVATYFGAAADTAATIGTAASVASAAAAAYGTYSSAQNAKAAAKANAANADAQAKDAAKRGEKAAIDAQRRGSQIAGTQRATLAGRGLDLNEGTPNDILGQTDFFTQSDIATARNNGRREANSYLQQRANYQGQADGVNPGLQLAGSLLGSAGSVADKWYRYKSTGG